MTLKHKPIYAGKCVQIFRTRQLDAPATTSKGLT